MSVVWDVVDPGGNLVETFPTERKAFVFREKAEKLSTPLRDLRIKKRFESDDFYTKATVDAYRSRVAVNGEKAPIAKEPAPPLGYVRLEDSCIFVKPGATLKFSELAIVPLEGGDESRTKEFRISIDGFMLGVYSS